MRVLYAIPLLWMLLSNPGLLLARSFVVTAFPSRTSSFLATMASRTSTRNTSTRRTVAAAAKGPSKEEDKERPQLYLLKSEPDDFSIDDLKRKGREEWDGIRNYTARNYMRQMRKGDTCWFYHSSCKTPAIVGTCRIVREAQPDQTALDPNHKNYDPKSTPEAIRWDSCLIEFDSILDTPITLKELRTQGKINDVIAGMKLLGQSRLSVMPVTQAEWDMVNALMRRKELKEDLLVIEESANKKSRKA